MPKAYADKTGADKFFADFVGRFSGMKVIDNTRSFSIINFLVFHAITLLTGTGVGVAVDKLCNKEDNPHIVPRLLHTKNLATRFRTKKVASKESTEKEKEAKRGTKTDEGGIV